MPTYRLTCVLRFRTGHAGTAFDAVSLGADGPDEAIRLAELYRCSTPGMSLSVAVLIDETSSVIWTRWAPELDDGGSLRSRGSISA